MAIILFLSILVSLHICGIIIVTPKGLDGGADKHREGIVRTID
jgi:ribosomal protein S27E